MPYHIKKARKETGLFGNITGTFTYNSQISNIMTVERLCDCSDKRTIPLKSGLAWSRNNRKGCLQFNYVPL